MSLTFPRSAYILGVTVFLLFLATAAGKNHYAAPEGRPNASGSKNDPWDIATALSQPPRVSPGDIIWLRGGRYLLTQTLVSSLVGAADAPIIVRQALGERATLDCVLVTTLEPGSDCLRIVGSHTWYWGFEIMNSSPIRWSDLPGSAASPRGRGVHSQGAAGTKLINLVIHDVGTALFESQSSGIEIYGNIVYNGGWDAPDRSHGPGFYIRNRSSAPPKLLKDNIIFQQYRQAIQGFGSYKNVFSNFVVDGNVIFNNGIGQDGFHRNLMFGNDNTDHLNNIFQHNYTYYSSGWGAGSNMFSSDAGGCQGVRLIGNVFAHGPGRIAAEINNCDDVVMSGNILVGKSSYTSLDQSVDVAGESFRRHFANNEYYGDDLPDPVGTFVYFRRNEYEPSRAHMIVYNWDLLSVVEIDLAALGLRRGDWYEIRSVQDYFGKAETGVYTGQTLFLPMTGWGVAVPIGYSLGPLPKTMPEFGAFVITWRKSQVPPRGRTGSSRDLQPRQ